MAVSRPLCTAPVDLLSADETALMPVAMPFVTVCAAPLVALATVPAAPVTAFVVSLTAVLTAAHRVGQLNEHTHTHTQGGSARRAQDML